MIKLRKAKEIALRVTSFFETGKDLDFTTISGNFDGQGLSFGILQWNIGQGTLQPLLRQMIKKNKAEFHNCFKDKYEEIMDVLTYDQSEQLQWAKGTHYYTTIKDSIGREYKRCTWNGYYGMAFKDLGRVDDFVSIQTEEATKKYHKLAEGYYSFLKDNNEQFDSITLRQYCALFDLAVQQGGFKIGQRKKITELMTGKNVKTPDDAIKTLIAAKAGDANKRWRADCLSRRLGILKAERTKISSNGHMANRFNGNYRLILSDHEIEDL